MRKLFESTYTGSDSITFYRVDATTIGVVQLQYWADMDESAVAHYGTYNVMSGFVSLKADSSYLPGYRSDAIRSALKSCGYELDASGAIVDAYRGAIIAQHATPEWDNVVAQAMWDYGARDVAYDGSGNNKRTLRREAIRAL